MKIVIMGSAEAFDVQTGVQVDDITQLRRLDGLLFDEDLLSNYIDSGPLADIGIQGGLVRLAYDAADGLRVVTDYHAPRALKPRELKLLIRFTEEQWSDGIGEGDFMHRESVGLDVDLSPSGARTQTTANQIDDGIVITPPPPLPLIKALSKRQPEKLEKLIAKGADVNARDKVGDTALHVACLSGEFAAAHLLLTHGADAKAMNKDGATPLSRLAMCNQEDHEKTRTLAEALLKSGADVEARDKDGRTPLIWASNRGKTDLMALLIERGAMVNAKDAQGYTVIMYCQRVAAAEILLRHGADPSQRNSQGKNAVENALMNSHWAESGALAEVLRNFKMG